MFSTFRKLQSRRTKGLLKLYAAVLSNLPTWAADLRRRLARHFKLLLMIEFLSITLRTLNYGNYGIFPSMGNAGF